MATHKTDLGIKWDVGVSINRLNPQPLDSTQNHSSIDTLRTYAASGVTSYVGQQVNVVDSNGNLKGAYIIKNTKGDLMELANTAILESLSGVFNFQGVAEAISLDQSIITIKSVSTLPVRDRNGEITKPSEYLYCITTAYEFDMDVYYGWGTSLEDIRFWTDTTTVNSDTPQYDKGDETSITAYEFNGKLYYPTGTEQKYESIDEDIVYIKEQKVYTSNDFTKTPIGVADEVTYEGCRFSVKKEKVALENTTSETITASPDNSGHVYQIGENEYASNGQIWVKLGAPTENWIML